MTPEEKALADAFLAECWRTVPEWHQACDERVVAEARNALLTPVDEPGGKVEKAAS